MKNKVSDLIYGPVPSRRLGMSLGIDPAPRLTCTLDCVYCQLGPTDKKVSSPEDIDPEEFPAKEKIIAGVQESLSNERSIDYITFSGSGEPTLNYEIDSMLEEIRDITEVPVALITNSSLLTDDKIFRTAKKFDLLIPSLDAADQSYFEKIDRPADGVKIEKITESLKDLAEEKNGKVWLEVMLVKTREEGPWLKDPSLEKLLENIDLIDPERVHLNTCVRPHEGKVESLSKEELSKFEEEFENYLYPSVLVEKVGEASGSEAKKLEEEKALSEIKRTLRVRPSTSKDIARETGLNIAEVGKYIDKLLEAGDLKKERKEDRVYYVLN